MWKCLIPINDLEYGYGGVKLPSTLLTRNMDKTTVDMTTSISNKFEVIQRNFNITKFNTDEWSTWKSAFRECAKLASKTIDRQDEGETDERSNLTTRDTIDPMGTMKVGATLVWSLVLPGVRSPVDKRF